MSLTDEQRGIIAATPSYDEPIIVKAFAGTGKTFTLQQYAHARLNSKMLYAAFNKAIQMEAKRKMPANVTARTTHSLAYQAIGCEYQRAGKLYPNLPVFKVTRHLGIQDVVTASFAISVVKAYLSSADTEIGVKHVDGEIISYFDKRPRLVDVLVQMAREIWDSMQKTNPNSLAMTHDGYLKLYQLSGPVLDYEYILLDEAQDTTPCVWDIMINQNARKVIVGDPHQAIYCQPAGTLVDIPIGRTISRKVIVVQVRIEDLNAGDAVVTYHNSRVYKLGRKVSDVKGFPYKGDLVRVVAETGETSAYLPEHHCIVRVGDSLKDKYVVYLMRKNDKFRIGRVPFFYKSQESAFGLAHRATYEKADAAWILSLHDSEEEASIEEALLHVRYEIPGHVFEPLCSRTGSKSCLNVAKFWSRLGSNYSSGKRCLEDHGLIPNMPLWVSGNESGTLIGVRRPFVTAAANLFDGMLVLTSGSEIQYKGKKDYVAPRKQWVPISVKREHYEGDIVSLEVEDHHTYYGDGILTHNSWRGAVDAMELVGDSDVHYLSKSFRFGPELAALASTLLRRYMGETKELNGNEELDTKVIPGSAKDSFTLISRGNNTIFKSVAFECYNTEATFGFVGGSSDNYRFQIYSDIYHVYTGAPGRARDPVIKSFGDYTELLEYAIRTKNQELKGACNIVEQFKHQIPEILRRSKKREVGDRIADLSFVTGHKSKGLEFPVVEIAGDFESLRTEAPERGYPVGELNLLYVALTRATEKLHLQRSFHEWILTGSTDPKNNTVAMPLPTESLPTESLPTESKKKSP